MAQSVAKKFRGLLRAVLSTSGKSNKQLEQRHADIRDFVQQHASEAALDAMLEVYLEEYAGLEARNDKNARYLSASVFEHVFELWTSQVTFFEPRLQACFANLLDNRGKTPAVDPIHKRYLSLDAVTQSKITGHLKLKRKEKHNSLSLFEILMDLFFVKNARLPETDAELFGFDPAPDSKLKDELDALGDVVRMAYEQKSPDALEQALQAFMKWSRQNDDVARCFQIFIWCRAAAGKPGRGLYEWQWWITDELYLLSVHRIFLCALNKGYGFVLANFLTADEVEVLLQPLAESPYYSDFADRLYPFKVREPAGAGAHFDELGVLHLRLLMFAEQMGFFLLSAEEMDDKLNALIQNSSEQRNKTEYVASELAGLSRDVRVGAVLEDKVTIVVIEDDGSFVITWKGIDHRLFSASKDALGKMFAEVFISELIAGTQHLLVLIPALFELLQYVASLCTGGITGLLEEIAENIIGDLAVSAAERLTDNRAVLGALGMIGPSSLAIPGKRIGKAALKAVRKGKSLLRKPKTNLPTARALKRPRRGGLKAKGSAPKAGRSAPKPPLYGFKRYFKTAGAADSPAAKKLAKKTDLKPQPLNAYALNQPWGQFQSSVAGGRKCGMVATLKDGKKKIYPDGIAHAAEAKGKVDLLEAKHEHDSVTVENFETNSLHWKYVDDKGEQMARYVQYVKENSKYVDKVRYICSSVHVAEIYEALRQALDPKLQKYIEVELDVRAP